MSKKNRQMLKAAISGDSGTPVRSITSSHRAVLEVIRLFNDRLDIEDRSSINGFDWAYEQAIGTHF